MQTADFSPGGFRFIPSVFQYSGGVVASPGYRIMRIRFMTPVALAQGFRRIEVILSEFGRPATAFCACELRSPAPFSKQGFAEFNKHYVTTLSRWKLFDGTINPVARINVCPEINPPSEPSFHAFSFTVPASEATASFVISGSEDIIRHGETSADALREKAISALGQMEERMQALGVSWADTTATQVYTVHDLYPFLADQIVRRGAAGSGLTWHFNRPPVAGLEFELDCRGVMYEQVVP